MIGYKQKHDENCICEACLRRAAEDYDEMEEYL